MLCLREPRLDYKPTSRILFHNENVNLLDELREIRRRHASPANQAIHLLGMILFIALVASTLVLVFQLFTFPLPILVFLLVLFFPFPYLGFYWYLDPVICIFWLPFFVAAVFASLFIADGIKDLVPLYAAFVVSSALAFLTLLLQLVGHLLLEKVRSPAFEIFEQTIMTPFFLGYCGVGWLSCWRIRRDTIDNIWKDEAPAKSLENGAGKDVKDAER